MKATLSISLLLLYLGATIGLCLDVDTCCKAITGLHWSYESKVECGSDGEHRCYMEVNSCCDSELGGEKPSCPIAEVVIDVEDGQWFLPSKISLDAPIPLLLPLAFNWENIEIEGEHELHTLKYDSGPPPSWPPFVLKYCAIITYG